MVKEFWLPVSAEGHQWIDANRARARTFGLLADVGDYNPVGRPKI